MRAHGLLLCAILGAAIHVPSARAADDAETHFKRGVALYQDTDFKGAAVEFRRAYEASHNFRVLYNVAQAEYQALDYAGALATFERYLQEGADKLPRARRGEVEQEIAKLKTRTGRIVVKVNVPGADVTIDDVAVGPSPVAPVLVGTGVRHVAVTKDGYAPYASNVEIAGGESPTVDVVLVALAAPPPPDAAKQAREPPRANGRRFPWEAWTVTGALAAAAAITGVVAYAASNDLSDARGQFGVSASDLDAKASRVRTFSIVSDVCLVGALVAGGVSLWLTLRPMPAATKVGVSGSF